MAIKVRIGHASTDEASSAAKEVLISEYSSNLKPTVVLRPTDSLIAEKSAKACEAGCNNDNIEYSQSSRGTLLEKAKEVNFNLDKINTKCYADCSSFMTVCALAGGAKFSYSYIPNCGNMRSIFTSKGYYQALTGQKYLDNSDYLQRGDILVRENSLNGNRHTVMVLDNGAAVPKSTATAEIAPIIKVTLEVLSINKNSINIKVQLLKISDDAETVSDISKYSLSYKLERLDTKKTETKDFKANNSKSRELTIKNLATEKPYRLTIFAKNDTIEVCSAGIVFFTSDTMPKIKESNKFENDHKNNIKNIFLKIDNTIKSVIVYLNK
jgi:hypothetical protein